MNNPHESLVRRGVGAGRDPVVRNAPRDLLAEALSGMAPEMSRLFLKSVPLFDYMASTETKP